MPVEDRRNMSQEHMEHLFIFAVMWGQGALLELDDRQKLQTCIQKHKSKPKLPKLQGDETIFEYMVNAEGKDTITIISIINFLAISK